MNIKKQLLLDFLKKHIFTTGVFIKTMIAVALLFFYARVFSRILPQGVNYVFVFRLYRWLLILMTILYSAFFLYFRHSKQKSFKYVNSIEGFYPKDLFLLLLPMASIVCHIILNQDILSIFDSIAVLTIFLAVSFILTFLIPAAIGVVGSRKVLTIVGLSFSYILFNMASLTFDFNWHRSGVLAIQVIVFAVFFTISLVIYLLDRKFLNKVAVVFFAVSTVVGLISAREIRNEINRLTSVVGRPEIHSYISGKELKKKPDIFVLTYDSYVENETMLKYGIDNSAQEDYLTENGFHIYKGTYSIWADSIRSMSYVLNIGTTPFAALLQSSLSPLVRAKVSLPLFSEKVEIYAVQNILKENGYETFGIFYSDYLKRPNSFYDHVFPVHITPSYELLTSAIFEGEFRFATSKIPYPKYLSIKRDVLTSRADKPRFLYTHSGFPGHSQNSGRALGNETKIFNKRLVKANAEMREDIEIIKKHNPNAIIIVNGDHGPYLTKNCTSTSRNNQYQKNEIDRLDIQDRFGSFLAIKWPDSASIDHGKIEILQDIFPLIFSYLYEDTAILNSRIEQLTLNPGIISDVLVKNGIIIGGKDDGKLLFDSMKKRRGVAQY